jgi:hypothetical protein
MYTGHGVSNRCDCKRCIGQCGLIDNMGLTPEERMSKGVKAVPLSKFEEKPDLKVFKYFIWSPESHLPSQVVFDSKADAIKVAYGMASRNPESRFCVCEVTGIAKVQKVSFEDFGG